MSAVTKRKGAKLASAESREESVWPCVFILQLLLQEGHFTIPATIEGAMPTVQRPLFSYTIVMTELDWHVIRRLFGACKAYRTMYLYLDSLTWFSLQLQQNVMCVNSHLVCMCRQNARMLMLVMTQEQLLE